MNQETKAVAEKATAEKQARIYRVMVSGKDRLVKARSRMGAIAYVARNEITAQLASQNDLVDLLGDVPVEDATAHEQAAQE